MEASLGFGKKSAMGEVVLCMFFFLVFLVPLSCEAISTTSDDGDWSMPKLEVQKHLKRLNKPAVKSIKSVDGDIIDCVNILHQPAFDHPDLNNHKIQMRPSFYPKGINMSSNSKPLRQLWHKSGRCPEGTIPIRRTKMEDILRAKSIKNFGTKEQGSFPQPKYAQPPPSLFNTVHEHALAYVNGEEYYGAKARINIWNPKVRPDEFSLAQIWVAAGSSKNRDLNTVEAGWMVYPELFGDNKTRLFTYWTRDAYTTTGCYNLACPGFIQTNKDIVLGARFNPVSKYGSTQYHMDITIWKDHNTKNWWLAYNNRHLGYWPASLFTYLEDESATAIEWGGEIVNREPNGHHTTTQMGSGHFPYERYGKASYFHKLQVVDANNYLIDPQYLLTTPEKNCYAVKTGISKNQGRYLYYGGPGRNPNCP